MKTLCIEKYVSSLEDDEDLFFNLSLLADMLEEEGRTNEVRGLRWCIEKQVRPMEREEAKRKGYLDGRYLTQDARFSYLWGNYNPEDNKPYHSFALPRIFQRNMIDELNEQVSSTDSYQGRYFKNYGSCWRSLLDACVDHIDKLDCLGRER